jgi:hypothetical protein
MGLSVLERCSRVTVVVCWHACVFVDLFIFFTYRGCGFEFEMVRCCNVDDEYTYALRVVQMAAV